MATSSHCTRCDCDSCLNPPSRPPPVFVFRQPPPVERLHMRCDHTMLPGLCVVPGCKHWDGVGKGAKAQAKSVKRVCATCPEMTTKVHCSACAKTEKVKSKYNQDKRLQMEGS